ncbi:MAG: hypothetical protein QG622_2856 [Actinomycetota bacterium]|nr:hypothetical protein [Actinomycetota bacterium]
MAGDRTDEWSWIKDSSGWIPPVIDTSRPSVARMYDFYLGGKDHFAVDRDAAEQVMRGFPDVAEAARANREFLVRSVRAMAGDGIDQFLDLGTGIPTPPNTHEAARQIHPGASIAYVDNDPVVMVHNRALLASDDQTVTVMHDLRDPATVLADPMIRSVIDFGRPVGLLMIAVLHFVDVVSAPMITSRYYRELAPGSQVAISVGVRDGIDPEIVAAGEKVYAKSNAPAFLRSVVQVGELLDGVEPVAPGLEDIYRSDQVHIVGVRATRA